MPLRGQPWGFRGRPHGAPSSCVLTKGARRVLRGLTRQAACEGRTPRQATALTEGGAGRDPCDCPSAARGTERAGTAHLRGQVDIALVSVMRDALLRRVVEVLLLLSLARGPQGCGSGGSGSRISTSLKPGESPTGPQSGPPLQFDRTDTGVDLVAEERDGGWCAIQCKFHGPDTRISKPTLDSFISASARELFTARIVVDTGAEWGRNASEGGA